MWGFIDNLFLKKAAQMTKTMTQHRRETANAKKPERMLRLAK